MKLANLPGLVETLLALGVVLALAAVLTTWNSTVHANSAPNLEVGRPSPENSSLFTGAPYRLSATVTNSGDGQSASTTLRYFRSANTSITTSDTEVGTVAVGELAASGASELSIDLTLPPAGTYFYGACVDSVAGESDTSDNCSPPVIVSVHLRPDLSMDGVNGPGLLRPGFIAPGGTFSLLAPVRNVGEGQSAATTIRYFQSTDTTITTSDTEVSTGAVWGFSPGSHGSLGTRLTAPSTTGTYYYGACVDTVPGESDTTNNCSGASTLEVLEPGPDLSLEGEVQVNHNGSPGGSLTLTLKVVNGGLGRSEATTLRYYQSTDATITTADVEVGTDHVARLYYFRWEPGPNEESIDLAAPSTVGTYYYGACVDPVTDEADTTNNCSSSVTVTVQNTPAAGAPTISGTAQVGQTLTAKTTGISDSDGLTNVSYSYQWLAGDAEVDGATSSSYEVQSSDSGKVIKVRVTFTDDAGSEESLTSDATDTVAAKPNSLATGSPTIRGTAQVGQTLTASTSDISDGDGLDNLTYSYQWLADDTEIDGATGSTYTVQSSDNGKVIKVRVTFTDDASNEESLTSDGTAAVVLGGL